MPTILGREKGFPKGKAEWDGTRLNETYDDRWKIEADNESQLAATIITSLNIPIGEPFPDDTNARAKTVSVGS